MENKKILIIGTYPIVQARHGGPKRAQAITEHYKKHFKNVRYVGVVSRASHPHISHQDIPVSMETDETIMARREFEDIICGESIFKDAKVKQKITKLLLSFVPDTIQIEQVYPYIGLKPLLDEIGLQPSIIYSSHNVESELKRQTYKFLDIPEDESDRAIAIIENAERELVISSKLVLAVSEADIRAFEVYGSPNSTALAPNGTSYTKPSHGSIKYWKNRFTEKRVKHGFTFVSSAHLPNWRGFKELIGETLGFLSPDSRIFIAGAMSDYLEKEYAKPKTPAEVAFLKRVDLCGRMSDPKLFGLIGASEGILLPITSGGGSNLKTAEALLSGKKVIGTTYAFRSFEKYLTYPNVWIADSRAEFRNAIIAAAATPLRQLTESQKKGLSELTWASSLRDVIKKVSSI